jgi:hypothetical protein
MIIAVIIYNSGVSHLAIHFSSIDNIVEWMIRVIWTRRNKMVRIYINHNWLMINKQSIIFCVDDLLFLWWLAWKLGVIVLSTGVWLTYTATMVKSTRKHPSVPIVGWCFENIQLDMDMAQKWHFCPEEWEKKQNV